jgi:ATP-binding cassette subfamily D (ALD) protein 3
MLAYLVVSGAVLTVLRRPVGRFTVEEQQLEGHFRHVTSRLITNRSVCSNVAAVLCS